MLTSCILVWGVLFLAQGLPDQHFDELDILKAQGRLEEYAKALGMKDAALLVPSKERKGIEETMVSPLGDILLPDHMDEAARQGLNFNKYGGNKWPNGEVPYEISNDFNDDEKAFINRAIQEINNRVRNVKIRPRYWNERNYVRVISGSGCWSYLGTIGGAQPLSLQKNGCLWAGTVQHEFIHAIGFTHEQNRPDRDQYVTILWDNIPQEWHSQYQKGDPDDYGIQGRYDPYSVMHYGYYAPGTGKPAFEFKDQNVDVNRVGNTDVPTRTDACKIDRLYS